MERHEALQHLALIGSGFIAGKLSIEVLPSDKIRVSADAQEIMEWEGEQCVWLRALQYAEKPLTLEEKTAKEKKYMARLLQREAMWRIDDHARMLGFISEVASGSKHSQFARHEVSCADEGRFLLDLSANKIRLMVTVPNEEAAKKVFDRVKDGEELEKIATEFMGRFFPL
jgi:hypothetical protein